MNKISIYFLFVITILSIAMFSGDANASNTQPKRLTLQGSQILDEQGRAIVLRGGNLKGISEAEANEFVNELRFNFVRLRLSFEPPNLNAAGDGFTDAYKADIDRWIKILSDRKVWINIEMRGNDELTNSDTFYTVGSADFNRYLNAWMYLATKYKDTDYIAAYGLLAEPSINHTKIKSTVGSLTLFQKTLMDHISTVDSRTPFIVGPDWNYDTLQYRHDAYFKNLEMYKGRLIYAVNFLTPKEWIKNGKWTVNNTKPVYPARGSFSRAQFETLLGGESVDGNFAALQQKLGLDPKDPPEKKYNILRVRDGFYQMTLTPGFMEAYLKPAIAFKNRHQVPMIVDQFGASTDSNGQLAYERDLITTFERNGLHWCRWGYNAGNDNRKITGNPGVKKFYVDMMNSLLAVK